MASIIGVGDNTVDRYLHLGKMFPGGNAVNVPVLAHRAGHPAAYIGWLAEDRLGRLVYSALMQEGVDISHCRLVEGRNAYCNIHLVKGERVFGDYSEGVCDQISLESEDFDFISSFDITHTSIYSYIDPQLEKLKTFSNWLSYDFSQEWDEEIFKKTLPFVDIAVFSSPNQDNRETRDLMEWCAGIGPRIILATRGEKGALLFDGKIFYKQTVVEAPNVVDTLGAGDAFIARFMVDFIDGISIQESLANASEEAARTCTYYGAFGHGQDI